MKKGTQFLMIITLAFINLFSYAQTNQSLKQLRTNILTEFNNQQGDFAVAFINLKTGKKLLINEKENFHAASTMKTPVMIEVFKQIKEGKFSLEDSITIKNEFKSIVDGTLYSLDSSEDSYSNLYQHLGEKTTLYNLVYHMIINSSNLATNLVIDLIDAKKVTKTMRSYGAKDIMVLRGVEDQKAYDAGLNNTTTAYDLALIFQMIATGKAVDKNASEKMIQILLDQQHNSIIPANLPTNVKVAHKTGSITGVHHDSGIVFLPDGTKYVLVILSKNIMDEDSAVKAMAKVSEMIYSVVSGNSN